MCVYNIFSEPFVEAAPCPTVQSEHCHSQLLYVCGRSSKICMLLHRSFHQSLSQGHPALTTVALAALETGAVEPPAGSSLFRIALAILGPL